MDPKPPSTTSWDDSDFDGSEGFLPMPKSEPENVVPTPQPSVAQSEPPLPPPPHQQQRERSSFFWFVATGIVVLVALIGFVAYKVMLPSTEDEVFFANEKETSEVIVDTPNTKTEVAVVSEAPVDTPQVMPKPESLPSIREHANSVPTQARGTQQYEKEKASATTQNGAVYAVQVFSSPSIDDAKEWLQLLKSKNVSDGYIAEQYIKGDAWYRVRFGQFSSKSDAEAAAEQLGFQSSWIARLR